MRRVRRNRNRDVSGAVMKRTITREKDGRYCTVEIEITDGCLSVCGEEGRVVSKPTAKKEALAYWRSFFEDNRGELAAMNERCGTRFTSATSAARYVLNADGEFYGLDASEAPNGKIRILESCGQIRETIAEWFPEVTPLLPWHLNDMKAACEHQDELGWDKRPIDPSKPLNTYGRFFEGQKQDSWNMLAWVRRDEHPEGLLSEPCPTCGYRYGTKWLKRDLPADVVALAETVLRDREVA